MDKIQFILDNLPDLYNKESDSNLYKVLSSVSKELDIFVKQMDQVKNAKFIDYATDSDLDRVAKILNMKRFVNETDESFRGRIKSKVTSFVGGGAISALKQVINNYLGVEPIIVEHYKLGEGHPYFDNGVLNGLNLSSVNSTNVKIGSGIAYANGNKYALNEANQVIAAGNQYLKYNLFSDTIKNITNFNGKISGSVVENSNIIKRATSNILPAPSAFTTELTDSQYASILTLDGTSFTQSHPAKDSMDEMLFSFNLIQEIERKIGKIPGSDTASKVTWLKNNISKLVANWYGWGTTVLSNPTGTSNFAGKVSGSVVENANIAKRSYSASATDSKFDTLLAPTDVAYTEFDASRYSYLQAQDNSVTTMSNNLRNGYISQQLLSFNLLEYVKRKYSITVPGADLAAQVAWLKANITSLTANWWGWGTNIQANPTGTTDFNGKVTGSTTENANISKHNNSGVTNSTSLLAPSAMPTELASVSNIYSVNGQSVSIINNVNGYISQHLFSFNLIEYVKRKYGIDVPGATVADQVAWLKNNLSTITVNWYGYGSGPSGNNATVTVWNGSTWLTTSWTNTTGSILKVSNVTVNGSTSWFASAIQSDGFIHYMAYAEASNGTIASTINTDYISLDIALKAGGYNASFSVWRTNGNVWYSNPVSHTNNTVSKLSLSWIDNNSIDSNGFIHYLAYADASNGISSSTINTDYISLDVTMKSGINKATLALWNSSASSWQGQTSHTLNSVSKLWQATPTVSITNLIDTNGYCHAIAYADVSNGLYPSTISTDYVELEIYMKNNTYISVETDNTVKGSQVLIGLANGTTITDMRNILNPEEHYITNTASITVQIPFNFNSSNIPLGDVKDILRNTKAAGIALLIKIMESYNESIQLTEFVHSYFLMGFSGIGGNNILGGR